MRFELCSLAILIIMLLSLARGSEASSYQIDAIPSGYSLYAYDDCGVPGRQPHVDMTDAIDFTFSTSDTTADLKSRSAVFSNKQLRIGYNDLDPRRSYVLVMTYASDQVYKRVQSLWANGIELHGPMALPNGKAIRVILKVPAEVTQDGKMTLAIKIHGEVNATASIVELWATGPAVKQSLRFGSVTGVRGVAGRVIDMAYDGVKDATVRVYPEAKNNVLATTTTAADGTFKFDEQTPKGKYGDAGLRVIATSGGIDVNATIPAEDLGFEPVRYRPIPSAVQGLSSRQMSLDGEWKINPHPDDSVREAALTSKDWSSIHVPGQWKQQGFDIPQDQYVAMAREFTIPKGWDGYRIFLRFDAIHAGTDYWVNGNKLGYSENLFTPVEWEITDALRPGVNRIDLGMKVATVSEKLSYSSGYAFHSLGGIDRSVRLYALPKVNVSDMRILTDLDSDYRDAEMKLSMTVENHADQMPKSLHPEISLIGPDGKSAKISVMLHGLGSTRSENWNIDVHVADPLKWSAEKPNLYRFVLELRQGDAVLERIERNLGFRKIEVRGRQVYINGQRVKFSGACHHEIDPLTGRADTMRHAEQDVKLMREGNLNYLRTSHYPPTQELLDACDRLGMYVECEAPFCWVQPSDDLSDLREVLTPTSAMIDYNHTHPSIIVWSLANESSFNPSFEVSNKLVKELDPTRLTTFNNPDPKRICDIANTHYSPTPWSKVLPDDPRPLFLGEYMFPVCHEQVDVRINPGMRELPGQGQSEPDSDYARKCAKAYDTLPMAGARPGFWNDVYASDRVIGGAIWAALDEPYYFKDGTHCGYAWVHGFWGVIDAWRRPKPELWLTKMIFSPVWFPKRQVEFAPGQESVSIPVENRYSFTDLGELIFSYEIGKKKGTAGVSGFECNGNPETPVKKGSIAPGAKGEITIPIPTGTPEGSELTLRVADAKGELVNVLRTTLGTPTPATLPKLSGVPSWTGGATAPAFGSGAVAPRTDDCKLVVISGPGWSLVFDRSTGELLPSDPRHTSAVFKFPALHVARTDPSDLNPNGSPRAELPDAKTRVVDEVSVKELADGIELSVRDHYEGFAGTVSWIIDKSGLGRVSYDYVHSGEAFNTREIGARCLLRGACDTLKWRRWSEWGIFPDDNICRTEGTAKARRAGTENANATHTGTGTDQATHLGTAVPDPEGVAPHWPWSQDQTELGTADFRGTKFNIYEASLTSSDGTGAKVYARADLHTRCCLTPAGVELNILTDCMRGPVPLGKDQRISGEFVMQILGR